MSEQPKKERNRNDGLTNGFVFSAETLVLAVLGSIGAPAYAEQVSHLMAVGTKFPLSHANVHRHIRNLHNQEFLSAKLAEKGRPLIFYSVTDKGKERLVQERAKALAVADLIDVVVPP